jgi:hypothetical protein
MADKSTEKFVPYQSQYLGNLVADDFATLLHAAMCETATNCHGDKDGQTIVSTENPAVKMKYNNMEIQVPKLPNVAQYFTKIYKPIILIDTKLLERHNNSNNTYKSEVKCPATSQMMQHPRMIVT